MSRSGDRPLTDEERFPLLDDAGRRRLARLREHPHAPRWTFPCGDRLTRSACDRIASFEAQLRNGPAAGGWTGSGMQPDWLDAFVERCLKTVPFYRERSGSTGPFEELPTCGREDLGRAPWAFVPDDQPLDDLLTYTTSGTTGNIVRILSHPVTAGSYLGALRVLLGRAGVPFDAAPEGVAIAQVCAQASTFTHATIISYLGGAGYVKINLNPGEWRNVEDPARFLDDIAPEILTGDPVAFAALAALPVSLRPRALVSSAMAVTPGMKTMLERRFGCPLIDVYSLNESRFVAVAGPGGHEILPHDLYVEILGGDGRICAPGDRGEIVLTCGRNPFLPLLRYRTGDTAALVWEGGRPVLAGLEGRQPVVFLTHTGEVVNSIDVTRALGHLPIPQFSLHQEPDQRLVLRYRGTGIDEEDIRRPLESLFGSGHDIKIELLSGPPAGKAIVYTSDIGQDELMERPWSWKTGTGR
ncbi:MAG TPA: capsule biosynthesis protein CapK [Candidatus Ozemobacteraceae bacterium]|nr:capsule biosynthesis protein CapK [Candidatus Ozemobacteraceae bacterium]